MSSECWFGGAWAPGPSRTRRKNQKNHLNLFLVDFFLQKNAQSEFFLSFKHRIFLVLCDVFFLTAGENVRASREIKNERCVYML